MAEPSSSATTPAHSAVNSVQHNPISSVVSHVWLPSAEVWKKIPQFQL
jgi:hypothetical protein